MSVIRAIVTFFKTWFLPQPAHDEAPVTRLSLTPPDQYSSSSKVGANHDMTPPESTEQASYAVPPIPGADVTDEGAEDRSEDQPAVNNPQPEPEPASDFTHLVKPPEAADMRYSRRRIEGADPGAFE